MDLSHLPHSATFQFPRVDHRLERDGDDQAELENIL